MSDIEPPPDDLRALFACERDVSARERAAIKHKLGATLAASAPAPAIAASKIAWLAAAALATAGAIWWWTHRDVPAASPVPAPAPVETSPAPEPAITATAPESPAPSPSFEETTIAEPSQAELLAKAWQALANDPAASLALVDRDRALHPKGALAEERDALHIQALAALKRDDEARTRAAQFLGKYPQSVHRKRVEAVLH
jgi:hypothetical protein